MSGRPPVLRPVPAQPQVQRNLARLALAPAGARADVVVIPQVLGGPQGVVDITVPSNRMFVRVDWWARSNSVNAGDILFLNFNGDVGANYDYENVGFLGAVVPAPAQAIGVNNLRVGLVPGAAAGAGLWNVGWFVVGVVNQTGARRGYTSAGFRNDNAFGFEMNSGAWHNTVDPVRSMRLTIAGAPSFLAGSVFTTMAW